MHWRWFGYVSPSYCTTWPSLVLAHFRFLLDHVFFLCCSTCQFSNSTRVMLPLDHMSLCYWTTCCIFYWYMCPFLIWPRITMMSVHVSYFYTSTWLDDFFSRVGFLIAHMSCPGQFTCHALIGPRVAFLFDHVACPGSTACNTNYIRKVIWDHHYCMDRQHNYSRWQSNTNN